VTFLPGYTTNTKNKRDKNNVKIIIILKYNEKWWDSKELERKKKLKYDEKR